MWIKNHHRIFLIFSRNSMWLSKIGFIGWLLRYYPFVVITIYYLDEYIHWFYMFGVTQNQRRSLYHFNTQFHVQLEKFRNQTLQWYLCGDSVWRGEKDSSERQERLWIRRKLLEAKKRWNPFQIWRLLSRIWVCIEEKKKKKV